MAHTTDQPTIPWQTVRTAVASRQAATNKHFPWRGAGERLSDRRAAICRNRTVVALACARAGGNPPPCPAGAPFLATSRQPTNSPLLSIIVPIRNQIEYNRLFLDSVRSTTVSPYELIVVDNASTDGSGRLFEDAGALVIRNTENHCYGCSMNMGLERAAGEYVAFLNNDILLSPSWDYRLIEHLTAYQLDVISPCGCETLETREAIARYTRRWKRVNAVQRARCSLGMKFTEAHLRRLIRNMYGDWERFTARRGEDFANFLYPGLSGFALLCRRRLFEAVGRWDTQVSASDFDLKLRMVRAQVRGEPLRQPMIAGDVFVHHFIRTTTRSVKDPYRCTHPFVPFADHYAEGDRQFAREPLASLVVAVHERPEFLRKLLTSLLGQSLREFEVVIADDGSGPAIADVVKEFSARFTFPIQHVWQPHEGFRKTHIANRAVRRCRAQYLVFIDGDVILHHRFLEEHYRAKRVGVVLSGRRVRFDRDLTERLTVEQISTRAFERPSFWIRHCETSTIKHGLRSPAVSALENLAKARKNYHILGSNFSLHMGDYYRINGYDERIVGRGLEDDNLANRFKVGGFRIRSVARRALQYHLWHTFDPTPHSRETIQELGTPEKAWTDFGLVKRSEAARQTG